MRIFVPSLLALIALGFVGCSGGNKGGSHESSRVEAASSNKVANGLPIANDELPATVAIFVNIPGRAPLFHCTGTFISKNHVLTAAHCLYLNGYGHIPPEYFTIRKYDNTIGTIQGVATHPSYLGSAVVSTGTTSIIPYDVGIMLVSESFEGDPVAISTRIPGAGSTILVHGFGNSVQDDPMAGSVLRAGVASIDLVDPINGVMVGQATPGEARICSGDSGGSAITQFSPDEPFVIVGVNSFATKDCSAPAGISGFHLMPTASTFDFLDAVVGAGNYSVY